MWCFLLTIAILVIFISICLKIYLKLTTGWCTSNVCLVGKTVLITGGNSGIGYETAADMAKRGATVILASRNEERSKRAVEKLIEDTNNKNISYKILDLSSLQSVRKFAEEINNSVDKLDILINNAGLLGDGKPRSEKTADGFEKLMQTNYFGHFLLTNLLLDLLKKSASSRIVNVSSMVAGWIKLEDLNELHNVNLSLYKLYYYSKLCNVLFTIELAKRLKNTGVTTYALHPGAVLTGAMSYLELPAKIIFNCLSTLFFKTSIEGAQTSIYCAVTKGLEIHSGGLFSDCQLIELYKTARDPDLPRQLWEKTEELLNLKKEN